MAVSKIHPSPFVVNARFDEYDVFIAGGSIWQNNFSILQGRAVAYQHYENHIRNSPELIHKLQFLKGKKLGCYCSPSYCHGHILQKLITEFYG